jgi:hypothetical protein
VGGVLSSIVLDTLSVVCDMELNGVRCMSGLLCLLLWVGFVWLFLCVMCTACLSFLVGPGGDGNLRRT